MEAKMADEKSSGVFKLTVPVAIVFPQLDKPRAWKQGDNDVSKAKFGVKFLFDPDSEELMAIKRLAGKVARERFPKTDFKDLHWPWANGDKFADDAQEERGKDYSFARGKVLLTAKSQFSPILRGIENRQYVEYDVETDAARIKKAFYTGVECLAQINLSAYKNGSNQGVTAYLDSVLQTGRGQRLTKMRDVETFKDYVGKMVDEDPTQGYTDDEEIPY